MPAAADELYSLLVPLRDGRLLLPRTCVVEVVRYQSPVAVNHAPGWLRGMVPWGERQIPVLCFEELLGQTPGEPGGRTRIALIQGIAGKLAGGVFGLLTEGFPQLVRVNRDVLQVEDQHAWPDPGPVICQVRMINEHPLIPDLESIEALIVDAMAGVPEPLT